ncbi:MAG: hypothetical protein IPM15_07230 [Betaproteobacteria bacterium]|nr:hypothetical protein [Betaproteobacteria bacterium]
MYSPDGYLLHEDGPQATSYVWLDGTLLGIVRPGPSTRASLTTSGGPR